MTSVAGPVTLASMRALSGSAIASACLLTACGTSSVVSGVQPPAQAGAPPASIPSGCSWHVPAASTGDRSQLPNDPRSATLIWDTGLGVPSSTGQHGCLRSETHLDGPRAQRLVAALKALPPPPSGIVHCPADWGNFVQIWFATKANYVSYRINLSGCTFDEPDPADLGPWPNALRPQG